MCLVNQMDLIFQEEIFARDFEANPTAGIKPSW